MTISKHNPAAVRRSCLSEMKGGWFVGAFVPSACYTADVEVAVQNFPAGYQGGVHHHKIATEVTLLLAGVARMAGEIMMPGDIVTLAPGTASAFEALTACTTVVVKHPGALNDKYDGAS